MKNESTENRLRVAAYIRVSTDHPNQEDSYEMQEQYFSALFEVKVFTAKNRLDTLRSLQEHMESYWEALEKDYECREKAIEWMAGLPDGKEGTIRFFNEVPNWVKAFALSITVHSSERYTVRWFDDVETEVKLARTEAKS